jgi:hypothetical protein
MPIRSSSARSPRAGSNPQHVDVAGVGAAMALEDLHGGRLAGAVGPSRQKTSPRLTSKLTPRTASWLS